MITNDLTDVRIAEGNQVTRWIHLTLANGRDKS